MKYLLGSICLTMSLMGCSGGSGGGSSGGSAEVPWNAYYVATFTDLPGCAGDYVGRLYYVEDDDNFVVCKSTGWATINIQGDDGADGADGASGITVSSVKMIGGSSTDYCTLNTGEDCYFNGGQVTTFSDGSFMIQFKWSYSYIVAGDTNLDTTTSTLFFPSTFSGASIPMSPLAARAGGYKTSYLIYVKSSSSTTVWADTDDDGTIVSGTDELLYTATLTTL